MTQHWVWVTGPDYYLDEDGNENPELDPDSGYATDNWWTCHRDTKKDDLVVLYRSTVARDIAYLIRATSNAHPLGDVLVEEFGQGHKCGFEVHRRFDRPVTIAEMKADPVVSRWPALRAAFVKSSWAVPDDVWDRLLRLSKTAPTMVAKSLEAAEIGRLLEIDIEKELIRRPDLLRSAGVDFTHLENQVWCGGGVGSADLVGLGRTRKPKIVIELKRGRIGPAAIGQVLRYREVLTLRYRPSKPIRAVVIGESIDRDAQVLLRAVPNVSFLALDDLDLECRQRA